MVDLRILVLASGNGSNFEAIHKACEEGRIKGRVVGILTNYAYAGVITKAIAYNIPCGFVSGVHESPAHTLAATRSFIPNLIALAGYNRIVPPATVDHFHGVLWEGVPGIINIHPADTQEYQGLYGHEFALGLLPGTKRLTETKITVHFVDHGVDTGPIIAQEVVPIDEDDTLDTLRCKGLKVEHELYPRCIEAYRTMFGKEV